jgi:hypothetical protein
MATDIILKCNDLQQSGGDLTKAAFGVGVKVLRNSGRYSGLHLGICTAAEEITGNATGKHERSPFS